MVDEELIPGRIPNSIQFDEAFADWKKNQQLKGIDGYAEDWRLDKDLLKKSVYQYTSSNAQHVPYRDELIKSVDLSEARKQHGNTLMHNIKLSNEQPMFLAEIEEK